MLRDEENKFAMISAVVFFLFFGLGFMTARINPAGAGLIVERIDAYFEFAKNLDPFLLVLFIFLNNAVKVFLAMVLGIFFGLVPAVFLLANGFVIGVFSAVEAENGLGRLAAGILPHGIFELAGVFLATGYGLWLGYHFFKFILFQERFSPIFKKAIKKYFQVAVPVLFIASLIEVFITPLFINLAQ